MRRVKKGQLWAYARDERPWAGHAPPGVAYVYAPDRKHARPAEHLARIQRQPAGRWLRRLCATRSTRANVALAFCWSHVRRQFYQFQVKTPAPIATQALVRIAALLAAQFGRPRDFSDLGPIGEEQRRSETELWREFELARPAILGPA